MAKTVKKVAKKATVKKSTKKFVAKKSQPKTAAKKAATKKPQPKAVKKVTSARASAAHTARSATSAPKAVPKDVKHIVPPIQQAVDTGKSQALALKSDAKAAKEHLHATAMGELAPLAKEINVRFEKAAEMTSKADDHRLSAALQLAAARKKCDAGNINFKKWCEEFIPQSYETIRKHVAIGMAEEPAKALEDHRNKHRGRQAAHRERARDAVEQVTQENGGEPVRRRRAPVELTPEQPPEPAPQTVDPMADIKARFEALDTPGKAQFLTWAAKWCNATIDWGL